jgi:hypothetical protein
MATFNISLTGTDFYPFSAFNIYDVLNGGYLYDPFEENYSFFQSNTADGGGINDIFSYVLSGGELKLSYKDLDINNIKNNGEFIFCKANVIFDLSNFDQTQSKIIKMVFDPKNGESSQTFDFYLSANELFYPNLSSIETVYNPSEEFYTFFNPIFKIYYEDGTIVNLVFPLTSIQCGIFESYKNKFLIESIPYQEKTNNVLLFINDKESDDLILTNLSTSLVLESGLEEDQTLPFESTSPLAVPFVETIALQEFQTTTIEIPIPPTNENPIIPQDPTPTPTVTPTVTPTSGISPTPTPTPTLTPFLTNNNIVTFDGENIITFDGIEIEVFSGTTTTNILTFDNENIQTFDGDPIIFF